jgi:hypothetical protein
MWHNLWLATQVYIFGHMRIWIISFARWVTLFGFKIERLGIAIDNFDTKHFEKPYNKLADEVDKIYRRLR